MPITGCTTAIINVDNQKMSKSLGNFFTVRDIAKEFDLEAVRMFMLSAQYRSPINFSRELIDAGEGNSLDRLYTARDHYRFLLQPRPRRRRRRRNEAAGAA